MKQEILAELPIEENTLLARHVMRWADKGIEVAFLVQGSQVQELMEQKSLMTKDKVQIEAPKPVKVGARRLLKGQKSPVTKAVFQSLEVVQPEEEHLPLTLVQDVDLQITVELGRAVMTLEELMTLKPKTTIPFTV